MNDPNQAAQWLRQAQDSYLRGDLEQALVLAGQAMASGVVHPAIPSLLAQIERERGATAAACRWMDEAITIAPQDVRLYINRAAMRLADHDYPGAEADAAFAVERQPDSFGAWLNLGLAREAQRNPREAIPAFERALSLRPDDLAALRGLAGALYRGGGGHHRAQPLLRKVLERDPDDAMSRLLLANALVDDAQIDEALLHHRVILDQRPTFHQAHSTYLVALQYHRETTPALLLSEHQQWAARHASVPRDEQVARSTREDGPLRVGWLSPRFGDGPVAALVLPVMEALRQRHCEQVLYPTHPMYGVAGERFKAVADKVHELNSGLPENMAHQVVDDALDVLIDLAGHAPENRLQMLSLHPAPLQVVWGDYFCTTGLPGLDVFLSDDYLTPEGHERWFSERVVRLPRGRFCYRPYIEVPEPVERSGDDLVFGCFNRVSKIGDAVLDAWAKILHACPNASMQLRAHAFDDDEGQAFFLQRARRAGLPVDRLTLHGACGYAELMASYGGVDIALDPFPFSGLVTSFDALWMGVPVVTCAGETLVSRQAGALLSALGLQDMATTDVDQYVHAAVALARDAQRRHHLRSELRKMVANRFDPSAFADDFLATLNRLVEDSKRGAP